MTTDLRREAISNLSTAVRENASDPDLPTVAGLRAEMLGLQQRLEAIVGEGGGAAERAAADPVATERIAELAEQVRQFHHAVSERRRQVGGRQRWFRRLWNRGAGARPGRAAATVGESAERAYRAREAQVTSRLFGAGLHHLR